MLNFTGSTRKRVVNLSEHRKPKAKGSYLEQAKIELQQREESRKRERNAAITQVHVKHYLELHQKAVELRSEWQLPRISSPQLWALWCYQVSFIVRFGPRAALNELVPLIAEGVRALEGCLDEYSVAVLIRTLNLALSRLAFPPLVVQCLVQILICYPTVPRRYPKALRGTISRLMALVGSENTQEAVDLIFWVNSADSLHDFVAFLAKAKPEQLSHSKLRVQVVEACLSTSSALLVIAMLSDTEKISLLINILSMRSDNFMPADYLVHANVILVMNFSLKIQSEDDENSLVQESKADEEYSSQKVIHISREAGAKLQVLYSTNYISHACGQLMGGAAVSVVAVQYVCLLMNLLPECKTRLCMMLVITPGLPQWLYAHLSTHSIFQYFKNAEQTADLLTLDQIGMLNGTHSEVFWDLMYSYEQVLSYWLIVSNDSEGFQQDKFTLDHIVEFTHFLKIFCLTLIFRGGDTRSLQNIKITRLKDISIVLLNQLYMKNLRLHFLGATFWKLKLLKFDISGMSLMILEDEEYYRTQDDSSDDDAMAVPKSRQQLRTQDIVAKLEVLSKVPFFVEFKDRVKVFQALINHDQEKLDSRSEASFFNMVSDSHRLSAEIHREAVLQDAFENFHKSGPNFKSKLKVTFLNEYGEEAGIDGGGLTKEFLTLVAREGFDPRTGLFKETYKHELYPSEEISLKISKRIDLTEQQHRLMYIKFLGMIIGKCLYESVLIDASFAPFFLAKWKGNQRSTKNSVNELGYLDRDLYRNLMKLLEMSAAEIEALDINFTVNEQVGDRTLTYDLLPPNGELTLVTTTNRLNYIHQVSNFKLNQSLRIQSKYFLEGLFELINERWLNLFDSFELQMLISGGNDIDIDDWKQNVQYGGYFDDDVTVTLFWEVVEEMSPEERCGLVKFVTSVSRAPLLGFGALVPNFGITNSGSSHRLPTASTCVNLLKLPDYQNKKLMREKLLYSISSNSGFDLS